MFQTFQLLICYINNNIPIEKTLSYEDDYYKANTRGYFNHGWLKTYHTFSFADYYNPRRIHFGALRVLNDDTVAPGEGFGMHPHKNMEVVSIPLQGYLRHGDNVQNESCQFVTFQ